MEFRYAACRESLSETIGLDGLFDASVRAFACPALFQNPISA
jgi:hypothetical protein